MIEIKTIFTISTEYLQLKLVYSMYFTVPDSMCVYPGKSQVMGEIKIALKNEVKTEGEQLVLEILQCRNITYKFKSPDHLPGNVQQLHTHTHIHTHKTVYYFHFFQSSSQPSKTIIHDAYIVFYHFNI